MPLLSLYEAESVLILNVLDVVGYKQLTNVKDERERGGGETLHAV